MSHDISGWSQKKWYTSICVQPEKIMCGNALCVCVCVGVFCASRITTTMKTVHFTHYLAEINVTRPQQRKYTCTTFFTHPIYLVLLLPQSIQCGKCGFSYELNYSM